jgi:hypothetical protein
MGVIDAGGQHVRVPVSTLLFGPSRTIGRALVALAPRGSVSADEPS